MNRSYALAEAIKSQDEATASEAMFDLGLRATPLSTISSSKMIENFETASQYEFKAGRTYNYHLSIGSDTSSLPQNKNYSKSHEFNDIINKLEAQWASSLPHILDACKKKFGWNFPKTAIDSLFCRGDLRAISPSKQDRRTTLGPHVDSERELFACLIYLRHPDDCSDGGSLILYEKKSDTPPKFMSSLRRVPMKYLDAVKEIKYESNKAILFINHPRYSIHSISSRDNPAWDRRLINLTFETSRGYFWDKNELVDPSLDKKASYQAYYSIDEKIL